MLRSLNEIKGYSIDAVDDNLGNVEDFYFDDQDWKIRYLVADTGNWLPGRLVLITPYFIDKPEKEQKAVGVHLTKKQIEDSPPIDQDKPVSKQKESELLNYYGLPVYWAGMDPDLVGNTPVPPPSDEEVENMQKQAKGNPHLRSTKEVMGYNIKALDGEIGHVEDFILDDEEWIIRYFVIETRNIIPGKKVIASPLWINEISWEETAVHFDLGVDEIKKSPEYTSPEDVTRDFEHKVHEFFKREKYWE
jgi:hypothetical protein